MPKHHDCSAQRRIRHFSCGVGVAEYSNHALPGTRSYADSSNCSQVVWLTSTCDPWSNHTACNADRATSNHPLWWPHVLDKLVYADLVVLVPAD